MKKFTKTKKYLCRYYYDNAWWGISIQAYDMESAQEIADKHSLQLDGEHVVTLPWGIAHIYMLYTKVRSIIRHE